MFILNVSAIKKRPSTEALMALTIGERARGHQVGRLISKLTTTLSNDLPRLKQSAPPATANEVVGFPTITSPEFRSSLPAEQFPFEVTDAIYLFHRDLYNLKFLPIHK
jgi:hypothetical protein